MRFETLLHTRSTTGWFGARLDRAFAALACLALFVLAAPNASAAQERMPPDAIAAGGCDWVGCTVAALDEDPDGPGADWATAADNNSSHSGHFSFGTPSQPLTSGAGLQEFRASIRKNSTCGTGTPTAQIELWENNALVRAGAAVSVTAANSCTQGTNCQVINFTWNATEVTSAANVEVQIFGLKAGGSPATRCAVDLGAVEWNADVTAGGPTLPTLSAPTSPFATIDTGAATLGATIDTNGGGTITEYGTVWGTAPTPTGGVLAAGTNNPAMPHTFSHARAIAQTPGTLIYFRGYADNAAGRAYSPDGSFYLEPNAPTPGVTFSNVTDTAMRISWALPGTGAGDGSIVVMKQGPAVDSNPVDGVAHVANTNFGSGAQLGTGNYVVFRASGTQVDVTGLSPSTSYAVAVYTYAGPTAPAINYQQDTPATGTQATNAPAAVATLSAPTSPFATIDTGAATLGATIDNDNGDAVTSYGTVWGTAASPTGNALAAGSNPGAIPPALPFTHVRTITQTPGTLIYFRGFADNGAGRGYSPDSSFYLEPNPPTPGVTFSNVTDTAMRISWTLPGIGAGDGSIVVMKQGPAVDSDPVDGVAHTASTSFGSGAQLGTGNYVVFRASGTQVDVTGLAASTSYAVAVYTYAGPTAPLTNYQQDTPATGTQTTTAPSAIATLSAPTSPFATIDTGAATLGATIDNDNGDAVTSYGTVWGTAASPTGNALAAGSNPGAIPPALPFSHARTITQTPGTLIYFRGFADNGSGRAYSPDGSFYLEPNQITGATLSNITASSMRVSWTLAGTGPGDGVIVVMKLAAAADGVPTDGTAHSAGSVFATGGTEIGPAGNYVVFRGLGTQVDVTGLAPSSTYAVAVYSYAGTGAPSINYQQDVPATASDITLAGGAVPTLSTPTVSSITGTTATLGARIDDEGGGAVGDYGIVWDTSPAPTANATVLGTSPGTIPPAFPFSGPVADLAPGSLIYFRGFATNGSGTGYSSDGSFQSEPASQASKARFESTRPAETQLVVSWLRSGGDGVIVLMKQGLAVDADPVDGTVYTFNSTFGSGPQLGTGNYVIYVGAGSQQTVSGILPDTTYHVAVYAYSGSGAGPSGINYIQSNPSRGSSGHNASHAINCGACHFGTGPSHGTFQVPRGADQLTACESCHNPTGPASGKLNFAIHNGTKYNANIDCGSCHEVHNSFDFTTTDTHSGGATAANVEWIRPNTTKYVAGALEPALFQNNTGSFAWDDANPPWNGLCQSCHQNTDWHRNDNSLGALSHAHNSAADCRTCHPHLDGFRGSGGDCTDCHKTQREISANPGTFRRQITESTAGAGDGEFGTAFTSHHVNDGTGSQIATKWDCVVCHAEGNAITGDADGTYHQKDGVQLKDTDTGVAYGDWSGLTASERSSFCLSCHDADGATIITGRTDPDPDATTNALNPFNDGVTNSHEPNGFDGTPAPHSRGSVVDVNGQFDTLNVSHHAVRAPAYVYVTDCVAAGDPHPCCTGAGTGPSCGLPFGSQVNTAIQGVRTDLDWNSVIDCEDCHIGPPALGGGSVVLGGHGTPNARYMLRDHNGAEQVTTPADDSTLICRRCHDPESTGLYGPHTRGAHMANDLNLFNVACLNCHGGGEWGGIHGVDAPVTDDDGGGSYNPNVFTYGSGLDLISNWTNWTDGGVSCSAMGSPTQINDCTQHSGQSYGREPARDDVPQRIYRLP